MDGGEGERRVAGKNVATQPPSFTMAVPPRTLSWLYSVLNKVDTSILLKNPLILIRPRITTIHNKLIMTQIGPTTMLPTRCLNTLLSPLGQMSTVSEGFPEVCSSLSHMR